MYNINGEYTKEDGTRFLFYQVIWTNLLKANRILSITGLFDPCKNYITFETNKKEDENATPN